MSAPQVNSFLSRPAKIPPIVAVILGVLCILVGLGLKGAAGGGLVGGGIALAIMGIWDFARLRYSTWRKARNTQNADQG
ncbi:MAG: hypothetical protein ACJ8FY_13560 [Gemmataceae bacterium]